MVSKLPLLNTYPIDLLSDNVYEEDIEKINEWEIETLGKLIIELEKQYKIITPDIYYIFFNEKAKPYKEYFLDETYEKILPENVTEIWNCRIDKNIPWEKSICFHNIAIATTSLLESEYLKIDTDLESWRYKNNNMDASQY